MKGDMYSLATIASIAPWIGIFGTVVGIVNSFQGLGTSMWAGRAAVWMGLSRAMSFTAFGLLVGLVALWSFEYLNGRLRSVDQEMDNASLELLNQLGRFPHPFAVESTIKPISRPMFGELPPEDVQREERCFRHCLILAGVTLAAEWFVQAARFVPAYDSSYLLSSAILYGCFYVPITFAVCCLFVYPFWAKVSSSPAWSPDGIRIRAVPLLEHCRMVVSPAFAIATSPR
jgi:hypothetical protein